MTKQEQKDEALKEYDAIIDLAWKECLAKCIKIDEQEEDK